MTPAHAEVGKNTKNVADVKVWPATLNKMSNNHKMANSEVVIHYLNVREIAHA